ncbi:MAG: hypothetical protein ABI114_02385 [Rhodanobacter sp.]
MSSFTPTLDHVEPPLSRYPLGAMQLNQLVLHDARKTGGHRNFDALIGADAAAKTKTTDQKVAPATDLAKLSPD